MRQLALILIILFTIVMHSSAQLRTTPVSSLKDSTASFNFKQNIASLPANFYSTHLPFVCDKELKMEKITGLPVKLRLGSVDYTNKLEGKNAPITGLH